MARVVRPRAFPGHLRDDIRRKWFTGLLLHIDTIRERLKRLEPRLSRRTTLAANSLNRNDCNLAAKPVAEVIASFSMINLNLLSPFSLFLSVLFFFFRFLDAPQSIASVELCSRTRDNLRCLITITYGCAKVWDWPRSCSTKKFTLEKEIERDGEKRRWFGERRENVAIHMYCSENMQLFGETLHMQAVRNKEKSRIAQVIHLCDFHIKSRQTIYLFTEIFKYMQHMRVSIHVVIL